MKKTYAIINAVVTLAVVFCNYYIGVNGYNGNTVGSLSSEYANLFTPAGYAFSIWGAIFFGLLAHAYYQIKKALIDKKYDDFILDMGPWLIIANLANIAWLFAWLSESTGLSVILMLVILGSLTKLIINLNMERWDAPFKVIRWIWWPIVFYAGWISVATIANVSAYLAKIGWEMWFDEVTWTIIMIGVATSLNLFMLVFRSMREFVAVGMWAILAIAVRHWGEVPHLQWWSLICVGILGIAATIHAYKNWDTNPLNKAIRKTSKEKV